MICGTAWLQLLRDRVLALALTLGVRCVHLLYSTGVIRGPAPLLAGFGPILLLLLSLVLSSLMDRLRLGWPADQTIQPDLNLGMSRYCKLKRDALSAERSYLVAII